MPENFDKEYKHSGLLEHGFERLFGGLCSKINIKILGIDLKINNPIYNYNFHPFKNSNYANANGDARTNLNNKIFEIKKTIILPNQIEILKKKRNLIRLILANS